MELVSILTVRLLPLFSHTADIRCLHIRALYVLVKLLP